MVGPHQQPPLLIEKTPNVVCLRHPWISSCCLAHGMVSCGESKRSKRSKREREPIQSVGRMKFLPKVPGSRGSVEAVRHHASWGLAFTKLSLSKIQQVHASVSLLLPTLLCHSECFCTDMLPFHNDSLSHFGLSLHWLCPHAKEWQTRFLSLCICCSGWII